MSKKVKIYPNGSIEIGSVRVEEIADWRDETKKTALFFFKGNVGSGPVIPVEFLEDVELVIRVFRKKRKEGPTEEEIPEPMEIHDQSPPCHHKEE